MAQKVKLPLSKIIRPIKRIAHSPYFIQDMRQFFLGFLITPILTLLVASLVTLSLPQSAGVTDLDRNYHLAFEVVYPIHYLIPFTEPKHLKPCSEFIDVVGEFEKALECSNREIFSKAPYSKPITPEIPQCYIITKESPDVHQHRVFNYINFSMFTREGIVGFYEDKTKVIYIVENTDAPQVWRHELQHYFLDLVNGDGNGAHDDPIWQVCEEPRYTPSSEAYRRAGIEPARNELELLLK